jgi:hypothetical protein
MRQALPPREVLQRAERANSQLDSARFRGEFSLSVPFASSAKTVRGILEGRMQSGGHQIALELDAEIGDGRSAAVSTRIRGQVILLPDGAFIRIDSLEQRGVASDVPREWIALPFLHTSATSTSPDPAMLNLQMQTLTVREDRGITTLIGHDVYHYAVSVDPTKFHTFISALETGTGTLTPFTADGELWIDADTFALRRVQWVWEQSTPGIPASLSSFWLDVSSHNTAPPVSPPENSLPWDRAVQDAAFQHVLRTLGVPGIAGASTQVQPLENPE